MKDGAEKAVELRKDGVDKTKEVIHNAEKGINDSIDGMKKDL